MQDLADLIEIVKSEKIQQQKIFSFEPETSSKVQELFNGIAEGRFRSDEEAARAIYNAGAGDKRYLMLKKMLADELVQSLSSYEYSRSVSEFSNDTLGSYKAQFAVLVLLYKHKRQTGAALAKKLLKKAEELHFTSMRIDLLRALRESSSLAGERKNFDYYCRELEKALDLYKAEMEAEETCERIEINLANNSTVATDVANYAEDYLRRTEESGQSSFNLNLNRLRIELLMHSIRHNAEGVLATSRKALEWLKGYPKLATRARELEFLSAAVSALLLLQRFELARDYAIRCSSYTPAGSYNAFVRTLRLLQAEICLGNFPAALDIFHKTVTTPGFERLSMYQKERWLIMAAYLALFLDKMDPDLMNTGDRKLRKALEKSDFWSEMHAAVQDKEGLNITLLIIQVMFLLDRDEIEIAKGRLVLIQKYMKRTVKDRPYERTRIFLQLIGQFIKHRTATKSALAATEAKLREIPVLDDIEYVPYTMLWEWLSSVRTQRKKKGARQEA